MPDSDTAMLVLEEIDAVPFSRLEGEPVAELLDIRAMIIEAISKIHLTGYEHNQAMLINAKTREPLHVVLEWQADDMIFPSKTSLPRIRIIGLRMASKYPRSCPIGKIAITFEEAMNWTGFCGELQKVVEQLCAGQVSSRLPSVPSQKLGQRHPRTKLPWICLPSTGLVFRAASGQSSENRARTVRASEIRTYTGTSADVLSSAVPRSRSLDPPRTYESDLNPTEKAKSTEHLRGKKYHQGDLRSLRYRENALSKHLFGTLIFGRERAHLKLTYAAVGKTGVINGVQTTTLSWSNAGSFAETQRRRSDWSMNRGVKTTDEVEGVEADRSAVVGFVFAQADQLECSGKDEERISGVDMSVWWTSERARLNKVYTPVVKLEVERTPSCCNRRVDSKAWRPGKFKAASPKKDGLHYDIQ
ncbi:hypothetical protein BDV98DRAFT_627744 [Pterulicium gracile]|uniref:Uncharacterized protein n=1 Tax=Pterulicium gracile TaxID=1884261 RepID=A0A5C3QFB0_9AGAR|nr:hypothetical protein BDV98DRAFT_627744 [Pterula gracilis]